MWSVSILEILIMFCTLRRLQAICEMRNANAPRNNHMLILCYLAVHCRRRKIRCLVAADDTQGRCENCIRLRKECQFFPVDQQPPIEKKSRPNSRLESQPGDHSVTTPISSSPTNLNPDSVEAFYPYSPMSMNASSGQDMAGFNPAGYSATPMSGFPTGRYRISIDALALPRNIVQN